LENNKSICEKQESCYLKIKDVITDANIIGDTRRKDDRRIHGLHNILMSEDYIIILNKYALSLIFLDFNCRVFD